MHMSMRLHSCLTIIIVRHEKKSVPKNTQEDANVANQKKNYYGNKVEPGSCIARLNKWNSTFLVYSCNVDAVFSSVHLYLLPHRYLTQ